MLYNQDPTVFYISGRIMIAIFGVATVLLTYAIACRLFNRSTGLLAAIFISLSPLHIYFSKLIRTDIQMTFLVLIAFWFCLKILQRQTWTSYILAGLFTGLATVTKYPAIIIALTIVIAHFSSVSWQWQHLSKLFGFGAAGLLGAFIGSPFLFFDFGTMILDVVIQNRPRHLSASGEGLLQNLVWYLSDPLSKALSIGGLLLSVVGIVLCMASKQKAEWLLISFPVIFLFFISSLNLRWERWVIPMLPFLCILAAHTLHRIITWLGELRGSRIALSVGCLILLGIIVPLLKADILQGHEMSGTDTRTLAREWMMDHIPTASRLLIESYIPELPKDKYQFFRINSDGKLMEIYTKELRTSVFRPHPNRQIGQLKDTQAIRKAKIEYMVLSNWYDRFLSEKEKYPDYDEIVETYETLMNMGIKIYEDKPIRGKNQGPIIRIYRFGWKD